MADIREPNMTDEEFAEQEKHLTEDEDFDIEDAPDESLDKPSGMTDGDIDDDSDFLETVIDDNDPILEMADGTRVGLGGAG